MKVRVRYSKRGKIRFLSHRDLARVWERALRRAGVRVAYSEGFSPRPRLSFGLALSTGHESLGEYLDVDLHPAETITPPDLPHVVNPALPVGMAAQAAVVLEPGTDSLQAAVVSSTWHIELTGADAPSAEAAIARTLAAPELPIVVERKGSETTVDARPAIVSMSLISEPLTSPTVEVELATQPRSVRPSELVRALDPAWREGRVLRTHQWTLIDGARCEPIPLGDAGSAVPTSVPHAQERAS